jgi:Tol biopolymer transport system component
MDVFLYERATGFVTLVSHVPGVPGTTGDLGSWEPVISADGAYVAFTSSATDLVSGDTNHANDVFLYSRASGTVTLVSHVPGLPSTPGNKTSWRPAMSADGSVVSFVSIATDLAGGPDTNGAADVFLHDRATGAVRLVSHAAGDPTRAGNAGSWGVSLSADGGAVAFGSAATDLVAATDTNGTFDVFVYEPSTGTATLVSHALGAPDTAANRGAAAPAISADGAFVAFVSASTNLAPGGGTNGTLRDVFLYERATGSISLVSHVPVAPGMELNGASAAPAISADGSVVVFETVTQANPTDSFQVTEADLHVYERATDRVTLVDHPRPARAPSISADGSVVVFSNSINPTGDQFDFHYLRGDVFAFVFTPEPGPTSGPDLVERTVGNPPSTIAGGGRFSVTDTVANVGTMAAAASTTTYYISPVPAKTAESRALGTRAVVALAAGASSTGTRVLTVPLTTPPATYHLIACADDLARVTESSEGNNCTAATSTVTVAGADLVVSAVSDPPTTARRGSRFTVTETVTNQGTAGASSSQTRFYFARDPRRETWTTQSSQLLTGARIVPALAAGASFTAPTPLTLTIPTSTLPGTYFLVACADEQRRVVELSEINNCKASAGRVTVP